MPKASAEATLKVKLQARALFELGKYTHAEICEAIKKSGGSLTRKTLAKWIHEDANDVWKVGERVNDTRDIINEKIAPQIIDKLNAIKPPEPQPPEPQPPEPQPPQNKHEAVNMVDRQKQINALTEVFMEDIQTNTIKTAYLGLIRIQELFLKNKSYYQGKEQTVGYENARNLDYIANATHKFAQILGFVSGNLQQNNFSFTQNNQINNQGGGKITDKLYTIVQEDPEYQNFILQQAEKIKKAQCKQKI